MTEHATKRPRPSVEEVLLLEMEDEESEPMTVGSDDKFGHHLLGEGER